MILVRILRLRRALVVTYLSTHPTSLVQILQCLFVRSPSHFTPSQGGYFGDDQIGQIAIDVCFYTVERVVERVTNEIGDDGERRRKEGTLVTIK